jgi:hypothetical protein
MFTIPGFFAGARTWQIRKSLQWCHASPPSSNSNSTSYQYHAECFGMHCMPVSGACIPFCMNP